MENKFEKIKKLKEEKDAIILAHYYTEPEVQKIADYVGDSYFLSEKAREVKEKVIVMCGVSFMGESVKLLNKDKIVLLPDMSADCPMAHMATVEKIKEMREKYEDLAVVCYVNSTAELKAHSDVCVTSANALKIAERLPNENIFFIPDQHLARYISTKLPEKNFIFNEGWCPIHNELTKEELLKAKEKYPNAKVAIHPECPIETVELGDYVGSTSGIIKYVTESDAEEFIICTEDGVLYELQEKNPNKKFYLPKEKFQCVGMKKITLDKIINSLETLEPQVHLRDEIITEANKPLENMLEMAK